MDISIVAYRCRIGNFRAKQLSYIPEFKRQHSYNPTTRTSRSIYHFKNLIICMILVSSIVSTLEIIPKSIIQDKPESRLDYSGSLAMGTDPVNYFTWWPGLCWLFPYNALKLSRYSCCQLCCYSTRSFSWPA